MDILILSGTAFLGYALGRIGHIIGGHLNTPHHWIYGVAAILVGLFFFNAYWGKLFIAFGIGHTISDLKDILAFKLYGPDEDNVKKFWGID